MLSSTINPMVSKNVSVEEVTIQIEDVANTMRQNAQYALRNLESTSHLAERTEALSANANHFARNTRRVRQKMWWKNCKYMFYCVLTLFIIGGGAALLAQTIKEESAIPDPPSPPSDV